jgi:hypothetical protein
MRSWVTAMRCRAMLSCRFPDRVRRNRTAVSPDQCGIWGHPDVSGERGFTFEPVNTSGFGDNPRGQLSAAGDGQQGGRLAACAGGCG